MKYSTIILILIKCLTITNKRVKIKKNVTETKYSVEDWLKNDKIQAPKQESNSSYEDNSMMNSKYNVEKSNDSIISLDSIIKQSPSNTKMLHKSDESSGSQLSTNSKKNHNELQNQESNSSYEDNSMMNSKYNVEKSNNSIISVNSNIKFRNPNMNVNNKSHNNNSNESSGSQPSTNSYDSNKNHNNKQLSSSQLSTNSNYSNKNHNEKETKKLNGLFAKQNYPYKQSIINYSNDALYFVCIDYKIVYIK